MTKFLRKVSFGMSQLQYNENNIGQEGDKLIPRIFRIAAKIGQEWAKGCKHNNKMANIIIMFISVIPFNVFTTDQLEYFHQLIIRMFISLTKYNFKSDVEA